MTPREQFIVALKNRLDTYHGVPSGPVSLAYRIVELGRQMGKTRALIEALPEDGRVVIVVHNYRMTDHIKDMILDLRGRDYPIKEISFVTLEVYLNQDVSHVTSRGPLPAFVDNAVYDILATEFAERVNDFFNFEPEKSCVQSTHASTASSEKPSKKPRKTSKKSAPIGT